MAVINVAIGNIWGTDESDIKFYLWPTMRYDIWYDQNCHVRQLVMPGRKSSDPSRPRTIREYEVDGTKR